MDQNDAAIVVNALWLHKHKAHELQALWPGNSSETSGLLLLKSKLYSVIANSWKDLPFNVSSGTPRRRLLGLLCNLAGCGYLWPKFYAGDFERGVAATDWVNYQRKACHWQEVLRVMEEREPNAEPGSLPWVFSRGNIILAPAPKAPTVGDLAAAAFDKVVAERQTARVRLSDDMNQAIILALQGQGTGQPCDYADPFLLPPKLQVDGSWSVTQPRRLSALQPNLQQVPKGGLTITNFATQGDFANSVSPQLKAPTMKTPKLIEQKIFFKGQDIATMSGEQIVTAIETAEDEIKRFKTLAIQSTFLDKRNLETQAAIKILVTELDSRDK